jgi:lipase maturation factor 1
LSSDFLLIRFVVLILATHIWTAQTHKLPMKLLYYLLQTTEVFGLINNYGPFAVMTTVRDEIIIEGSNDGEHWLDTALDTSLMT